MKNPIDTVIVCLKSPVRDSDAARRVAGGTAAMNTERRDLWRGTGVIPYPTLTVKYQHWILEHCGKDYL
jgi:hypothetical protein